MCKTQAASEPDGGFEGLIGTWLLIHHRLSVRSNDDLGGGAEIDDLIPKGIDPTNWDSDNIL